MSNTTDELAFKGSKLCTQITINNQEDFYYEGKLARVSPKHRLDDLIGLGSIEWISPLSKNNFREYELSKLPLDILKKLKLDKADLKSIWPSSRQPQWDAIGITSSGKLVLLEAKAHIDEMFTPFKESKGNNDSRSNYIKDVLGDNPLWFTKYYQLANRLVVTHNLKKLGVDVIYISLFFVNDVTHIPTSEHEYETFLNELAQQLNIPQDKLAIDVDYKNILFNLWRK